MRTLNRPMFRIGGSAGEGITSGLAPRQRYAEAGMAHDYEEKLRMLQSVSMPPDRSRSDFMIDWGLGMVSGTPRGNILSTAAQEAKEPFQRYKESQARRGEMGTKLGLSAATSAMAHSDKMKQIAAAAQAKTVDDSLEKLTAYYLDEYKDYFVAKNRANFDLNIRSQIANAFGDSQVGGIIDQGVQLGPTNTDKGKSQEKWMKQNSSKVGQVFYDINDGQIKRLIQQPGTNTLGFEVIDPATLTGMVPDTETQVQEQKVASTGLSQAQAEIEAEKRGYVLITRPDGAPRGWLAEQKRKNPNAITKTDLEEIIRMEEFSKAHEHLKDKTRVR